MLFGRHEAGIHRPAEHPLDGPRTFVEGEGWYLGPVGRLGFYYIPQGEGLRTAVIAMPELKRMTDEEVRELFTRLLDSYTAGPVVELQAADRGRQANRPSVRVDPAARALAQGPGGADRRRRARHLRPHGPGRRHGAGGFRGARPVHGGRRLAAGGLRRLHGPAVRASAQWSRPASACRGWNRRMRRHPGKRSIADPGPLGARTQPY